MSISEFVAITVVILSKICSQADTQTHSYVEA